MLAVLTIGSVIQVAVVWLHRPTPALVSPEVRLVPDLVGLVRSLLGDPSLPEGLRSHWSGNPEGFDMLRRLLGI